jgi:hypothetical protein
VPFALSALGRDCRHGFDQFSAMANHVARAFWVSDWPTTLGYNGGMDQSLKFIRNHKLAFLAVTVFVYAAKFACNKSTLAFDVLVLVAGGAVLVAIYRWEPNGGDRTKMHNSHRRRYHR